MALNPQRGIELSGDAEDGEHVPWLRPARVARSGPVMRSYRGAHDAFRSGWAIVRQPQFCSGDPARASPRSDDSRRRAPFPAVAREYGQWLFVHNGFIADFHLLRRDLMLAVDPTLFSDVHGSTDTEVVFHLALTFGLEEDPILALERTAGLIETTAGGHGVDDPVQGTFGISDGTSLWAVRYASAGRPRSLFASADVDTLRRLHPENPRVQRLSSDDRVIVSEPFSDLPGVWHEIPPATAVTVRRGGVLEEQPFQPLSFARSATASVPDV